MTESATQDSFADQVDTLFQPPEPTDTPPTGQPEQSAAPTAPPASPSPAQAVSSAEAEAPAAPAPSEEELRRAVPLAEHIAERKRLQAAIAAAKEEAGRELRAMQERLAALEKPQTPAAPAPAPEPEPDFLEDPKSYIDRSVQRIEQAAREAREKAETLAKQTEEQTAFARFTQAIAADEQAFVAKTPDYESALNFLRAQREAEIRVFMPDLTAEQMKTIIGREELSVADEALRAQQSPAERVYRLARARGYAGATPAPSPGATPAPSAPAARYEQRPRSADPSLTLGSSAGNAADVAVTEEQPGDLEFSAALREAFGRR